MRLIIYIVTTMIVAGCRNSIYPLNNKQSTSDSFIDSLFSNSKYMIMKNATSPWNYSGGKHICLAYMKGEWKRITFEKRGYTVPGMKKPFDYLEIPIKKRMGDSIYKVFLENKFVKIENDNLGCDTSEFKKDSNNHLISCGWRDAETYHIYLKDKSKLYKKSYYDAFRNNDCCPGNKDRQIFIKCYNAISNQFINKP